MLTLLLCSHCRSGLAFTACLLNQACTYDAIQGLCQPYDESQEPRVQAQDGPEDDLEDDPEDLDTISEEGYTGELMKEQ